MILNDLILVNDLLDYEEEQNDQEEQQRVEQGEEQEQLTADGETHSQTLTSVSVTHNAHDQRRPPLLPSPTAPNINLGNGQSSDGGQAHGGQGVPLT